MHDSFRWLRNSISTVVSPTRLLNASKAVRQKKTIVSIWDLLQSEKRIHQNGAEEKKAYPEARLLLARDIPVEQYRRESLADSGTTPHLPWGSMVCYIVVTPQSSQSKTKIACIKIDDQSMIPSFFATFEKPECTP